MAVSTFPCPAELSTSAPEPLPPRFKDLKSEYFHKKEEALKNSWKRLLPSLEEEVGKIQSKGSDVSRELIHLEL